MKIDINNVNNKDVDLELVRKTTKKFLEKNNKQNYSVSIAFVDDEEIQKINKKYRQKNKPTDVLSFEGEDDFLGEIIIDYPQVIRQAQKINSSPGEELIYILVHGLLHLLGYDDQEEEESKKMKELAEDFINNHL